MNTLIKNNFLWEGESGV